ncbi:MAG: LysR family transcriptional regulator, partial [Gammaproteobacteria bacterium]|nr:LysR family transcriptional regulator [Gammaproteobacteria bacterium]
MPYRNLPALNLLVTFEVAARHLSFTEAATELCITQSAVSRQIKALEEQLGVPLFQRLHRALELTPEGQKLLTTVMLNIKDLQTCIAEIRA